MLGLQATGRGAAPNAGAEMSVGTKRVPGTSATAGAVRLAACSTGELLLSGRRVEVLLLPGRRVDVLLLSERRVDVLLLSGRRYFQAASSNVAYESC